MFKRCHFFNGDEVELGGHLEVQLRESHRVSLQRQALTFGYWRLVEMTLVGG